MDNSVGGNMKPKVYISILALLFFLPLSCVSHNSFNLKKSVEFYNNSMQQADELAKVLCKHSAFSVCFWKNLLGEDLISQLPHGAYEALETIEKTIEGKSYEDLTECDKGTILACWLRFTGMLTAEMIEKMPTWATKFIALF